jgi:ribosomal protein S18 acetylase RimI-like enzyme
MGVIIQTFKESYPDFSSDIHSIDEASFGSEDAWNSTNFYRDLEQKDRLSFCAVKEDKAVGYIIGSYYNLGDSGAAHINRIAVDPSCRKLHIGNVLVDRFEAAAKSLGIELLTLEFNGNLRVDAFYQKCGFGQISREKEIMDYVLSKNKLHTAELYLSSERKVFIKRLYL